jgi:hypothetical protein
LICAGAAVATLLMLCGIRLRAHLTRREAPVQSDTYANVERIRSARGARRR